MSSRYSKRGIVILCSIVYFVSYFSRKDFAAVMAAMLSEGVLEKQAAGLIGTMLFIFYGIGQLLSGYLGDRISPQYLIFLGVGTTAVCNLVMPLVPAGAMIPLWGLNGLAQAMLWPPIVRILSDHLDHEQFVSANLIVTTAAHVATILLYLYVPLCLRVMSWHAVFYSAAILAGVTLAVFALCLHLVLPKETPSRADGARATKAAPVTPLASAVRSSGLFPIFGCIVMCGFLRDGIETWLPTLYSEAFHRDASESILVSVALPIFSILAITLITALHRRRLFNHEVRGAALLFATALVFAVPLYLLIETESPLSRTVCLVLATLICAAMHGVNFLLISCLPGRFAQLGRASTVSGLCNSCIYIGAAASTYGIALVAESLGWAATILSWIGVAAIGAVLAIPAYRRYSSFIRK